MADETKGDADDKPAADAFNAEIPKTEKQPDATGADGAVDKDKLREQIERQKEKAAEADADLAGKPDETSGA